MISVHTSPLEQPGTGDAGGLNVYVAETAKELAARGVEVDIFTRRTTGDTPVEVELVPGVTVRHVTAGPYEGLSKEDLPGQLCAFSAGTMQAGLSVPEDHYDLVHSHYWLSGPGRLARGRPLARRARPLDAHDGAGQEPAPRRGRHPRAARPRDRRGAGRRGRRPPHRQHPRRGARARRAVCRGPRDRLRRPPGGRPHDLHARGPACRPPGARAAGGRRRAPLRRPDPAAQGARRAAPGRRRARPPRPVAPAAPHRRGRRRPQRQRDGPPARARGARHARSASPTSSASSGRSGARCSPSGTGPPTSSSSRATASPSGSSRSSRSRAAPRSSRPTSAGCRQPSGDAGVLVDGHATGDWADAVGALLGRPASARHPR